MYGSTDRSSMQRGMVIAGEFVCLLIAYWFLFMGGNETLHLPEGHYDRQVAGFALLTRNPWAALVPFFLILLFVFLNIPQHDRYLRDKYGSAFIEYEKKTKRLIPFV